MSRPNNARLDSSESHSGQKIYVWFIATSAFLLLGLMIWPMTVNRFEATSVFQLRYEPTSGIEKTALNSMVVQTLRDQTDRGALADIFSQMQSTLSSDVLKTMDPEQIRQAIKVQGRPGALTNSVEYRLSLEGSGTDDEVEFINSVVSRINENLSNGLNQENHASVIARLTEDYGEYFEGRLQLASGQLSNVIESLATFDNDLKIAQGDLHSLTNTEMQMPGVLARPSSSTIGAISQLKAERERLLIDKNQYHPDVMRLQREIERLEMQATSQGAATSKPTTSRSGEFRVRSGGSTAVVKNQFMPAQAPAIELEPEQLSSQSADLTAPIGRIIEDIKMIDLTGTRNELAGLQNTLTDNSAHREIAERLGQRAINELRFETPISLTGIEIAKHSAPSQRAPNLTQFLWILGLAGVFGSVLAFNFDPACKIRRFRSVEQVSKKLNLPVVGVLKSRKSDARSKPINKVLASQAARLCEWTLLGLAVLLILAALVNSQVAAAFIENPFHGVTKTFWLMTGR